MLQASWNYLHDGNGYKRISRKHPISEGQTLFSNLFYYLQEMKKSFTIKFNTVSIKVESTESKTYNLKYPDYKFLMLEHNTDGWVVEDRSGDYWTDEDIKAIGSLIEKSEKAAAAKATNSK